MVTKKTMVSAFCFGLVFFLLSLLKMSFVWGSKAFFLSGFMVCAPVLAAFFGLTGLGSVFLVFKGLRFLFFGSIGCVTAGLPTLAAACCWSVDYGNKNSFFRFVLNMVIPAGSFLFFLSSPSVDFGFWFALYWLIPVMIFLLEITNVLNISVVTTAIRSTFVAHAVGSVLWSCFVPMTPVQWLALIPIVAVERLVFVTGMLMSYKLLKKFNEQEYKIKKAEFSSVFKLLA